MTQLMVAWFQGSQGSQCHISAALKHSKPSAPSHTSAMLGDVIPFASPFSVVGGDSHDSGAGSSAFCCDRVGPKTSHTQNFTQNKKQEVIPSDSAPCLLFLRFFA
jgi:hypothetical protein